MEDTELKPCPFCGQPVNIAEASPRLFRPSRNHKYHIECPGCQLFFGWDVDYGGQFDTVKEAAEAWNRRDDRKD